MSGDSAHPGSSYFDIHAALAEDTRMPARLTHGAKGVAEALDPATGAKDLPAGALLDLPLWALAPLVNQQFAEARCGGGMNLRERCVGRVCWPEWCAGCMSWIKLGVRAWSVEWHE